MEAREILDRYVLVDGWVAKVIGLHTALDEVDIEYHDDLNKNGYMNNESRNFKDIQPIPLTEEWLVRFGFQEREKSKCWFHVDTMKFELFKPIENMGYYRAGRYSTHEKCWYQISEPIKTVHQLQNLYFCLTGKELTL